MKYYIQSTEENIHQSAFYLAYSFGYKYFEVDNVSEAWKRYIKDGRCETFPFICFDIESKEISACEGSQWLEYKDKKITLNNLLERINIATIKVELNKDYTAIVSADSIKVGCQTFTHEAIEELYKASQSVRK